MLSEAESRLTNDSRRTPLFVAYLACLMRRPGYALVLTTVSSISASLRVAISIGCLGILFANATEPSVALTFERDVRLILKASCSNCYRAEKKLRGGIDLRLRRLIASGGDSGAALSPGKPNESLLLTLLLDGDLIRLLSQ